MKNVRIPHILITLLNLHFEFFKIFWPSYGLDIVYIALLDLRLWN